MLGRSGVGIRLGIVGDRTQSVAAVGWCSEWMRDVAATGVSTRSVLASAWSPVLEETFLYTYDVRVSCKWIDSLCLPFPF